jgi:hypothetical protein
MGVKIQLFEVGAYRSLLLYIFVCGDGRKAKSTKKK